jgi:hypothetical protein
MPEQNKSVGWVVGMLALAVAYGGWGFMAADYFQHVDSGGAIKVDFWVNSLNQIPNFFGVIRHAMQNRLWLVLLIVGLEVGVLVLGIVLKKLEKELWST